MMSFGAHDLQIRLDGAGARRTLAVAGEIDVATAGRLRDAVADALRHEPAELVFDLRAVTYLDSSGLGVLLTAHRTLKPHGGAVSVVSSHPSVRRALQITGLDATLKLQCELPERQACSSEESRPASSGICRSGETCSIEVAGGPLFEPAVVP